MSRRRHRAWSRSTLKLAVTLGAVLALFASGCTSADDTSGDDKVSDTTADTSASTDDPGSGAEGTDALDPLPDDVAKPIVFVHGFAGSAQQYESQAMRFVANGYPAERIVAYDHDGAGFDIDGYAAGLSDVIDETLETFDVEQVYLVGHSRGTFVSSSYLEQPEHAAKVARYVALDGQPCVDVVPCLAPTQDTLPGQAHVEVATSPESFAAQYEFLVGEAPEVVDIVAQRDPIQISGRAVNFPANTGRDGAELAIWPVDADTGARSTDEPLEVFTLDSSGEFGPVQIDAGAHYEFALTSPDSEVVHHLYPQPYLRSSRFMRLLSSAPDGATRQNTNTSDDHVSLLAIRMREWFGNGAAADSLTVAVDDAEPVEVITDFVGNGAIGLHVHDDAATPGETTRAPLPYFSEQPFQSGVDVFLPATPDGSGTVTVTNLPRGDDARPQVVNVPRWPSSGHTISVVFTDWPVDGSG